MPFDDKNVIAEKLLAIYQKMDSLKGRVHVAREQMQRKEGLIPLGCHVHDFWEIKIAIGGKFLFETPSYKIYIKENGVLLTPPHLVHVEYKFGSEFMAPGVCYFYIGHRYHNKCEVGLQYQKDYVFHSLTDEEWQKFMSLISFNPSVIFERLIPPEPYDPVSELYQVNLLRLIISSMILILRGDEDRKFSSTEWAIHKTLGVIESNYHQHDLTIKDIGRLVGMSPAYLNNVFKKRFKKSLWRMIIELRLEKAEHLLKQKKYSIKEVAFLSGWTNPLYFSRVFMKVHKIPPSKF